MTGAEDKRYGGGLANARQREAHCLKHLEKAKDIKSRVLLELRGFGPGYHC